MVRTGGHSFPLRRTYGDVRPGEFLALINSFGVVEIARAEQSAADALGLGRGAPVTVVRRLGCTRLVVVATSPVCRRSPSTVRPRRTIRGATVKRSRSRIPATPLKTAAHRI